MRVYSSTRTVTVPPGIAKAGASSWFERRGGCNRAVIPQVFLLRGLAHGACFYDAAYSPIGLAANQ